MDVRVGSHLASIALYRTQGASIRAYSGSPRIIHRHNSTTDSPCQQRMHNAVTGELSALTLCAGPCPIGCGVVQSLAAAQAGRLGRLAGVKRARPRLRATISPSMETKRMTNQYHMDLERFSLEELRQVLETGRLLPSESILKEEIPQRFAVLESMGIRNLKDLTGA